MKNTLRSESNATFAAMGVKQDPGQTIGMYGTPRSSVRQTRAPVSPAYLTSVQPGSDPGPVAGVSVPETTTSPAGSIVIVHASRSPASGVAGVFVNGTTGEGQSLTMEERHRIAEALQRTGGNQTRAAELLGMNRNTLRKKLQQHGLD